METGTRCPTCHGIGETQTFHRNGFTACAGVWAVCDECDGEGVVYNCRECMDTGVDLLNGVIVDGAWIPAGPCPNCHGDAKAA